MKEEGIYAYVTLNEGLDYTDELGELKQQVRSVIGPIATPDVIRWAPALPKIGQDVAVLRKIATDEIDQIGDTSTLADPAVVDNLISQR